jgi:hypothetical protein
MTKHRIEQAAVTGLGFLIGAILAICITPGDVFLWIMAGIVLAIFSRAFFICDFGGDFLWPFARPRQSEEKKEKSNPVAPQH